MATKKKTTAKPTKKAQTKRKTTRKATLKKVKIGKTPAERRVARKKEPNDTATAKPTRKAQAERKTTRKATPKKVKVGKTPAKRRVARKKEPNDTATPTDNTSAAGSSASLWYEQLQTISAAITEQYNSAALRYQELVARGYSPKVEEQYNNFTKERGTELFNQWMQLVVNFGESTQKAYQQYLDELFDGMEHCYTDTPVNATTDERQALTLEGELGTTLAGSFVVENDFPTAVTPRLLATSLLQTDGGVMDGALLVLEPSILDLAPNQKQSVTVRVPLDATLFEKGAKYTGAIAVVGLGGADRVVTINIRVR